MQSYLVPKHFYHPKRKLCTREKWTVVYIYNEMLVSFWLKRELLIHKTMNESQNHSKEIESHIMIKSICVVVLGQGWREGRGKGVWGGFEGDGNFVCFDCGRGFLGVCICQSSLNYILNWHSFLYVNYSWVKLILKY